MKIAITPKHDNMSSLIRELIEIMPDKAPFTCNSTRGRLLSFGGQTYQVEFKQEGDTLFAILS